MNDGELTARKREIREAVRQRRRVMSPKAREASATSLTEHLISLVRDRGATSITCYLSTEDEPDTSGLLAWARAERLETLLPVSSRDPATGDRRLEWVMSHGDDTARGAHGLHEPVGPRLDQAAAGDVDLMLIPASAVDARGMRMGWGLGYYDRCLTALSDPPPVFALVFDEEVLDGVPTEAHDSPVSGWVTPSGVAYPA